MRLSSYQRPHNLYMGRMNRYFTGRKLVLWVEKPFTPLPQAGVEVEDRLYISGTWEASAPEMDVPFSSDLVTEGPAPSTQDYLRKPLPGSKVTSC